MKKVMNNLLVVDGENLLHRSYHKFENFKSSDGVKTGAIYGFFKTLHSNLFRFSIDQLVVAFDSGKRSSFRTELLPNYKGSRTKLGMDYISLTHQKKVIIKVLKYMGVAVIFDKRKQFNYECDDYIAYIIRNIKNTKVFILSSDKDFCQLIDKDVKVINPSKDTVLTVNNCYEVMGYKPHECVDYLCLVGDNSDNIPGIPGIGPKKARVFLDSYGSIENYIHLDKDGVNKVIKGSYPVLRSLIDLSYFIDKNPLPTHKVPIKYGKYNKEKLDRIFITYSMTSLRSSEFLQTFENLKKWRLKE